MALALADTSFSQTDVGWRDTAIAAVFVVSSRLTWCRCADFHHNEIVASMLGLT